MERRGGQEPPSLPNAHSISRVVSCEARDLQPANRETDPKPKLTDEDAEADRDRERRGHAGLPGPLLSPGLVCLRAPGSGQRVWRAQGCLPALSCLDIKGHVPCR